MSEGIIIKHSSSGLGGTLTINTSAGVTVTATKDDKTKITTANSQGIAVIKGLTSGTWQVSIDDTTHEPTTPIPVEIVLDYNVTITFFSATIKITYPAGSICTATDGVSTFKAPDTSGTWTLIVPNQGTWTIKSTKGTFEKSQTVKVSTSGEVITAPALVYELVLYEAGNQCTSITGGWYANPGASTAELNSKDMYLSNSWNSNTYLTTEKSIDVSNYTSVRFNVSAGEVYGNWPFPDAAMIFAITNDNGDYPEYLADISYDHNSGFGAGIYNLSIEAVQKGYIYIKAYSTWVDNGSTGGASATITKVWLE